MITLIIRKRPINAVGRYSRLGVLYFLAVKRLVSLSRPHPITILIKRTCENDCPNILRAKLNLTGSIFLCLDLDQPRASEGHHGSVDLKKQERHNWQSNSAGHFWKVAIFVMFLNYRRNLSQSQEMHFCAAGNFDFLLMVDLLYLEYSIWPNWTIFVLLLCQFVKSNLSLSIPNPNKYQKYNYQFNKNPWKIEKLLQILSFES